MKFDTIQVNGFEFRIGKGDTYGPVFMLKVGNQFFGCRSVKHEGDEIGFKQGVFATKEQAVAVCEARKILIDRYKMQ